MRKLQLLAAGIASIGLLAAVPANAALVIATQNLVPFGSNQAGATYTDFGTTGAPTPVSGGVMLGNVAGGNIAFTGGGAIETGSSSGKYAQPAGSTGNFLSTGFNGETTTVTTEAQLTGLHNYLGLYWGSIDKYNTLNLYNGSTLVGTVVGNQVGAPADGNQASGDANRYVNISSTLLFDRAEFVSTSPAFELDNIALTAAVPEASTWAMMLFGFLGLGFLGYRKSSRTGVALFRLA